MKKKAVVLLMAGCLTIGALFAGCGSVSERAEATMSEKEDSEENEKTEKEEKNEEESKEEEKEREDREERDKEDKEEKDENEEGSDDKEINSDKEETDEEDSEKKNSGDKKKKSGTPVLGDESAEGYEGFEYLYEEVLMTDSQENEESGKMEKTEITVFIPKTDYPNVNRDYASADKMGVSFMARLNPYLQYDYEDYTAKENLEAFLEEEFDEFYTTDLEDLELSEVEELSDDAAVASAKYCRYDEWEKEYAVFYNTYYLKEIEPEVYIMVETEVNSLEASSKATGLLEEISAFYEFEAVWDADEAQAKLDKYLASDTGDTKTVSTGFLKCELPKGWKEDTDASDYDMNVYAPNGDIAFAECGIIIMEEYMGSDMDNISGFLADEEFINTYVVEQLGDEVADVTVEEYGETCIGDTVMLGCTYVDGDDDIECRFYLSGKEAIFIVFRRYSLMVQQRTHLRR